MPLRQFRKKIRGCLYGEGASRLFVPTEAMWRIHEASKPTAILKRAGLSPNLWAVWWTKWARSLPEFFKWLYHKLPCKPPFIHWRADRKPRPGAIVLHSDMLAFRRESSRSAIATAARLAISGMVRKWLGKYAALEWFEPWFLRGADAPPHVHVVTPAQLQAATRAWDYRALCRQIHLDGGSYDRWFKRGLVANDDWLAWLFGAQVPAGWLVVTESMQRFRTASTHKSIAEAAGFSLALVSLWRNDPLSRQALQAAIELAGRAGRHSPSGLAGLSGWEAQPDATKESIWGYAQEATLVARSLRAGITKGVYLKWLRAASDLDARYRPADGEARSTLEKFLNPCRELFPGREYQQEGIIAPGLFLPTQEMLDFRRVASQAMAEGKVWATLRPLPHFAAWMRDWATPMSQIGRRSTEHWRATSERDRQAAESGRRIATESLSPPGSNRAGSEPLDATASPRPNTDARATPPDATHCPMVTLGEPGEPVIVCGQVKPPLSRSKYRIVEALLEAWPAGLTKDELSDKANYSDPYKLLKELARSDQDWAEAIVFPGEGYRGGYRIKG
jgi:hypothetical protein